MKVNEFSPKFIKDYNLYNSKIKSSFNIVEQFIPKINLENTYFKSYKTLFLQELFKLSDKYGLGKVYYEIEYNCGSPEKIFYIDVPDNKDLDELYGYYDEIIEYMETFSKENIMESYFKEVYIIFNHN